MADAELYAGREQTLVKHVILRQYLNRFAHIIGSKWDSVTYVDCFSGPWNSQSVDLSDTSFAIAVRELREARDHLRDGLSRNVRMRCLFLEKDPKPYDQLVKFAESTTDLEVKTKNAELEQSITDISCFIDADRRTFPFLFIDPTGWTGFAMQTITPLLRRRPGEVLINFMTGHILRFADHSDPAIRQKFDSLFGSSEHRARWAKLSGRDREEMLVQCYCDAARAAGEFEFVVPAVVLHPEKDRTHFHLIYATRHKKGVQEFKKAEEAAMSVMEQARAQRQQRSRVNRTRQPELFTSNELIKPEYYDGLRERNTSTTLAALKHMLSTEHRLGYDRIWAKAMQSALVWEADLKGWIDDWRKQGLAKLEGLSEKERTPKLGAGHSLVWLG